MFTVKKETADGYDGETEFKNISCLRLSVAEPYEVVVPVLFKNISCLRLSPSSLAIFLSTTSFKNISCLRLSNSSLYSCKL